jgi:hypothetical protein
MLLCLDVMETMSSQVIDRVVTVVRRRTKSLAPQTVAGTGQTQGQHPWNNKQPGDD